MPAPTAAFHQVTTYGRAATQWHYERGRQWATVVSRHVKLKINGKLTAEAVRLFRRHSAGPLIRPHAVRYG
jgi:hypothetical protein